MSHCKTPKTFKTLSLADRVEVLKRIDCKESQVSVAKHFGINPSQICRIVKLRQQIMDDWQNNANPDRKRKRTGKAEDVEEALLRWFSQARSRQLPVSGPMLIEKANQFAAGFGIENFSATNGWLERWKKRENIKFKQLHGEKQDADDFGAERWVVDVLPNIIKEYDERNIFIADETGLYWRALPEGTLAFKQHDAAGSKVPKDRLTLLLACNMDGSEKLPPLIIGKSKNPRCFKNVKNLPVTYEANRNAWMTGAIWLDWLKKLDSSMRSQKRKIIMFCDNCSAHSDDIRLTNIKLVFMPPNTTSLIQPMDQGIIANFKRNYRSLVLRRLMTEMDGSTGTMRAAELARKITLLGSLHMQKLAWIRVSTSTIVNCYRRASFVKVVEENNDDATDPDVTATAAGEESCATELQPPLPDGMSINDFNRFVEIDHDALTSAQSTDEEICESVKPTADPDQPEEEKDENDSDDEEQAVPDVPLTFANVVKGLDFIRAYLESTGCESYETFYALSNQIYDRRLAHTQTTMTDYFRCE